MDEEMLQIADTIMTAGRMLHDHINRLKVNEVKSGGKIADFHELSIPQANVILAVNRLEQISVSGLANHLGVSPPSASTMVDKLVEKGFLLRKQSSEDRRKVVISIAPDMKKEMATIEKIIYGRILSLVEKVGIDSGRKWRDALLKVKEVLDEQYTVDQRPDIR